MVDVIWCEKILIAGWLTNQPNRVIINFMVWKIRSCSGEVLDFKPT